MTKAPLAGRGSPKRSLLVEARNVPSGLCVAGANKNDCKLFVETLWSLPVERPVPTPAKPPHPCLDKGHDCEQVRWVAEAVNFVAYIRSRGEGGHRKAGRAKGPPLAGGTHPLLEEPLPQHPCSLDKESGHYEGHAPVRLRPHRLPVPLAYSDRQ